MCNDIVQRLYNYHGYVSICAYIKFQTEEICERMLTNTIWCKHSGYNLKYVQERFITDKLCTMAIDNGFCSVSPTNYDILTENALMYCVRKYPNKFYTIPKHLRTERLQQIFEECKSDENITFCREGGEL